MAEVLNPLITPLEEALLTQCINRMMRFIRMPMPEEVRLLALVALRTFISLRYHGLRLEHTPLGRQWFEIRFVETLQLEEAIHIMARDAE